MKKFLVTLICFAIFTFILYSLLVVVWAHSEYHSFLNKNIWTDINAKAKDSTGLIESRGHMFSRIKELKETKDVDILFLGSSQAYRGFDPRIFDKAGYKTFNLGSSNQTPLQTELLIDRYLNQLNPKQIIFSIYPEVLEVDGIESTVDLMTNDNIKLSTCFLVAKQKNIKLTNTLIYAIYRDLFKQRNNFHEPIYKENDTYIGNGFVEKDLLYFKNTQFNESNWNFNNQQIKSLERIVKKIKKHNIELLLVQPPTPKAFYDSHSNNKEFDDQMIQYARYYNFNQIINLDDSLHFYDAFHMNQRGVEIFDKKLIELIQ